jgi:hypothetical protein
MRSLLQTFEEECEAAGVHPSAALIAADLNRSTWFRWKNQQSSPTLRSLERAFIGLRRVIAGGEAGGSTAEPPA